MTEVNEKVEEPQEQASERSPIHPELLRKILEVHRKWIESEGKEGERANLNEANLQEANLYGANLQGVYLHTANLQKADLHGANLYEANLYRANLYEANLYRANLQEANLGKANLQGAYLHTANLQKADLHGANLQEAYLADADGLTASQVKVAKNWKLAFYRKDFLKELGLPPDHNERLKEKLAELEKEKKATGSK